MAYGNPVPVELWEERQKWLWSVRDVHLQKPHSHLLHPQVVLICNDLKTAFCSGAWVSVITLANVVTDMDSWDRRERSFDFSSKPAFQGDPDLKWLQKLRNKLVYLQEGFTTCAIENIEECHASLEADARRAVEIALRNVFKAPPELKSVDQSQPQVPTQSTPPQVSNGFGLLSVFLRIFLIGCLLYTVWTAWTIAKNRSRGAHMEQR